VLFPFTPVMRPPKSCLSNTRDRKQRVNASEIMCRIGTSDAFQPSIACRGMRHGKPVRSVWSRSDKHRSAFPHPAQKRERTTPCPSSRK
jgi:hypothetical protein